MEKTVLYPFNNLAKDLIKHKDLLDVEIKGVFDFNEKKENKYGIDIKDVFDETDNFILLDGNFKEEHKEKMKEILKKLSENNVDIISAFEIKDIEMKKWIIENKIKLMINLHTVSEINKFINENEKNKIDKKIKKIMVLGISDNSEKFSLQMDLYRELKKEMKVMNIVDQDTGFMFDMPQFVKNQKDYFNMERYIKALENDAKKENCDCMILGSYDGIEETEDLYKVMENQTLVFSYEAEKIVLIFNDEEIEKLEKCINIINFYSQKKVEIILLTSGNKIDGKLKEKFNKKFGIESYFLISDIDKIKSKL